MGLRHRLARIRRRRFSIVVCALVVTALVLTFLAVRAPDASATAEVVVHPQGTAGRPGPTSAQSSVPALVDAVTSPIVVDNAIALVPGSTRAEILETVVVRRVGTSNRIEVTATSARRARAADIANAMARAFVEAQRQAAIVTTDAVIADLDAQLVVLQERLGELDRQIGTKSSSSATTAQLTAATTQFQALEQRRQELRADLGDRRGAASVSVEASGNETMGHMSPLAAAGLGALLFLVLSAIVVSLREVLDERVRSSQEIGRITGLAVLAELPRDQESQKSRSHLAVAASPRSPLSEAARGLRSSIELRETGFRHPTMLVTSATRGEGKSLVSANLAAAYAIDGYRTVLIDADLRTPALSTVFGTYPARLISSHQAVHGLSSLVTQLMAPGADRPQLEHAALLRTPIDNLLFLPAGPEPANPSELLDSRAMSYLLADLARIADVVIIDSPPLLPVSDAVGLARQVDSVVLVAAVGTSHRSALRRSRQILAAHPRVLGVVANRVAPSTTYSSYAPTARRSGTEASPALLSVVHALHVPTPPVGRPDANGDVWIDLSDDPADYDQPIGSGTLELSTWGR